MSKKKSKKSKLEIGHSIKQVDMSEEMQNLAIKTAKDATNKAMTENKIARQL